MKLEFLGKWEEGLIVDGPDIDGEIEFTLEMDREEHTHWLSREDALRLARAILEAYGETEKG